MPRIRRAEVTDNGRAEKWGRVELVPHPKLFSETGTIWQNAPKPEVKMAHGMILVASCQEVCDVK